MDSGPLLLLLTEAGKWVVNEGGNCRNREDCCSGEMNSLLWSVLGLPVLVGAGKTKLGNRSGGDTVNDVGKIQY